MAEARHLSHLPLDECHHLILPGLSPRAAGCLCERGTQVHDGDDTMKGIGAYQQTVIGTQSKGRLIVMLYDGAIKFMKLAIQEMEAGNHAAKGQYINRAQDVINELNAVLDMEAGGEIARNLRRLYVFMNRRLSEANTKRDPQMIRDVITLMEELNQSWKAIAG
jgi:flagellar protein FliS